MTAIRYTLHNWISTLPPRVLTVDVPLELAHTDQKVIAWLQSQQPHLVLEEQWEVARREETIKKQLLGERYSAFISIRSLIK